MMDIEARQAIEQQGRGLKQLFEAVGEAAEKQKEAEARAAQEKATATLIEVQSKIYDKASAYTNLIMIGGYAGGFAIWAATRPQLSAKANVVIALALGISLFSFVLFEVYKMTYTAIKFMKNRSLIVTPAEPVQFVANLKKLAAEEQKLSLFFMPVWISMMVMAVGGALIALGLLFFNYFAFLVGWASWPS